MAIGAPTLSASFQSVGTALAGNAYKDVTLTVAVGDRLVAFGLAENNAGVIVDDVVTVQAGPGAVAGGWTYGRANVAANNDATAYMAYGTVTTAGAITLRIQIDISSPTTEFMGVGCWLIPAADVGGNPRYVIVNGGDVDGRTALTLAAISDVLTAIADWTAGAAFGTTTTPAGGIVDVNSTNASHYTAWAARQLAQPIGSGVSYGPGGSPTGRDVAGVWFVQDTVGGGGGGSFPLAAIVTVVSAISATIGEGTAITVVVPVVTATTGILSVTHPLAATVVAVSSVSATVQASHPIAATTAVVSAVSASIGVQAPGDNALSATFVALSGCGAASLGLRAAISSTIPVVTAVSATLALKRSLAVTVPVRSTMSGSLGGSVVLAVLIPIVSAVLAAIEIYNPPTGAEHATVYGPDPDTELVSSAASRATVYRPGRSTP